MRPDLHAGLVGNPQFLRLGPLAVIPEVPDIFALGKLFRRDRRQGLVQHRLGGGEMFLHMRRRERQHRADAFKTLPARILGQAGRIGGVEIHAEQIADRVRVFLAGQFVEGHTLAPGEPGLLALLDLPRDPFRDARRLRRPGLGFTLRRHFARADPLHHIRPVRGGKWRGEIPGQRVQPEIPLLLLLPVTAEAVLGQERLHDRVEARRGRSQPARGRDSKRRGQDAGDGS